MSAGTRHLQCAEVWGGNRFVETHLDLPGLDAWVYAKPVGGESGGDVHYLSSCASGQYARMLLADVSGHGQSAAQTAEHLRRLMGRYVIYHSQIELTRGLNRHFARFARDGAFATALVGTFDARTARFTLTNAGHPPPFYYQAATGRWRAVLTRTDPHDPTLANVPLGIERHTRYEPTHLPLAVGDLLLWYTDSLIESRDTAGELLAPDGLLDIVRRLDPADPAAFLPSLLSSVAAIHPGNLTQDDITALLLCANGRRPYVSLRNQLLSPLRQVRAFVRGYLGGPA